MRTTKPFLFLLVILLLAGTRLSAQSFDKELAELATSVSKSLQETERKKTTVLDFTDLQGNVSELGRFLAEQFSVALVMNRKGFSLMDRANLKTILAEHKLTISGLVEPENAKKLGQFSGVDAIILGNITALKEEIVVTVKVIATDTAEILGAAKARIPRSKDIEALVTSAISNSSGEKTENGGNLQSGTSSSQPGQPVASSPKADLVRLVQVDKNSTQAGDLFIRVESVRQITDDGRAYLLATLAMVNTNTTTPLLARITAGRYHSTLTDNQGNVYQTAQPPGIIGVASDNPYNSEFTEIEPNKAIKVTIRHAKDNADRSRTRSAVATSYRLEFVLALGTDIKNNQLIDGKKRSVLIEVEAEK